MRFLDLAKVQIRSGSGGSGAASFRREKFVEFGGPDGGDGGDGGSVYAVAVSDLNTLIDYRYQRHVRAGNGQPGKGRQRTGGKGRDIEMQVPVGTEILDESRTTVIAELLHEGQRELLAQGGRGGFGNLRFRSSTNRAPRTANPGQAGIERTIWLRLKMYADIGLLGLPNAGKSTLIAAITNARPKVADYPFTTLHPVLGMLTIDSEEFVLADIPGLVEGAHEGRGIGDRFLGHIERCQMLLHLVDAASDDIIRDYQVVVEEIQNYGHGLQSKPRLVLLSKADIVDERVLEEKKAALELYSGHKAYVISAISGQGVKPCMRAAAERVRNSRVSQTRSEAWTP
ncbi:MAG: GTPase ObgE [Rhodobacteraceae bacterium]|nr:GTPase ObgE [Paracoccaceae bacterium]